MDEATSIIYSTGKSSGIVIDFGFDQIKILPIVNNNIVQSAVNIFPIGGINIEQYLSFIITKETSFTFTSSSELDILQDIKEKNCYFRCEDNNNNINNNINNNNMIYELPDGQEIKLNEIICISPPEIIFSPSMIGRNDIKGLQHEILQSIMKIPASYRPLLLENIILVGGGSKLQNFSKRLYFELKKLLPPQFNLPPLVNPSVEYPSFVSCSKLIEDHVITSFITKEQYYQYGAQQLIPD